MTTMAYRETAPTNHYEFTSGAGYVLPEYPFVPPPELQGGAMVRHPVVIVGGGITGLTLACSLARLGVRAVLIDEDNTVGVKGASSRGICYTQKSLEIFDRLGIYQRIAAKGVQWSVGRTFAGHDEVYSFDLRQQGSFGLSSQPPFINIQQFYIEGFLVERLNELGVVDLRWQNRLTAFEQTDEVATLTVDTPAGRYRMQADHVGVEFFRERNRVVGNLSSVFRRVHHRGAGGLAGRGGGVRRVDRLRRIGGAARVAAAGRSGPSLAVAGVCGHGGAADRGGGHRGAHAGPAGGDSAGLVLGRAGRFRGRLRRRRVRRSGRRRRPADQPRPDRSAGPRHRLGAAVTRVDPWLAWCCTLDGTLKTDGFLVRARRKPQRYP